MLWVKNHWNFLRTVMILYDDVGSITHVSENRSAQTFVHFHRLVCLCTIAHSRSHRMPTTALCVVCLGVGPVSRGGRCTYCLACRGPWYCSIACQRLHWVTEHRHSCPGYDLFRLINDLHVVDGEVKVDLPKNCQALILRFARDTVLRR